MGILTFHVKVKDYGAWRPLFDGFEKNRVAAGVTNPRVFRKVEDANDIVILFDVADVAKAKTFLASPELKAQMQKAGVTSPPMTYFGM